MPREAKHSQFSISLVLKDLLTIEIARGAPRIDTYLL